jgi:BNR repeat-containing family member
MKRSGLVITALGIFFMAQAARADWTAAQRLTWTVGLSFGPAVAVNSSNTIHIVWYDNTPGNSEIYYKKSTNGGASWGANRRLTWTAGYSSDPSIAVDSGGSLHVAWGDDTPGNNEVYYKRSTDGGTTWNTAKRLTWTAGQSYGPVIAGDSKSGLYVVWYDDTPGNDEIYCRKSADGGTSWGAVQRLTWTSGNSRSPSIAIGPSDAVHVVWEDYSPGNVELYYKRSADGGASWSAAQRITWTSGSSGSPSIAIDSSNAIHVVWAAEIPGDLELFYKKSTNGGDDWGTAQRLTWNSGSSSSPSMAIDSGQAIHIVWMDSTPGDPEIYYRKSTNGGAAWSSVQRLTWNSGNSYFPVMAIDSTDTIHIVWRDDTPGNIELYYKSGQ